MPQTTAKRASRWPGMDGEAMDYLKTQGYKLTKQWGWIIPKGQRIPTKREKDAILYLIEEWDFDGWYYHERCDDCGGWHFDKSGNQIVPCPKKTANPERS